MNWKAHPTEAGYYYWQSSEMSANHLIVVQVSEYRHPNHAPGKFHVGMLLPTIGLGYYNYNYHDRIEDMPKGKFWGPLPVPD